MHDIYDPPPAPVPYAPPKPEPLVFTRGDLVCLVTLCSALCLVAGVAWWNEPTVAFFTALGGALVILESWFTALGFLHRFKPLGLQARWTIFIAALVPWLIGLGIAATLMLSLFWVSDQLT
jgi:hypothetical protein